jgi:hypothetical protein
MYPSGLLLGKYIHPMLTLQGAYIRLFVYLINEKMETHMDFHSDVPGGAGGAGAVYSSSGLSASLSSPPPLPVDFLIC